KVEGVHKEALTTPDATPKVDTARNIGPLEKLAKGRRTGIFESNPVIEVLLEAVDGLQLRLIGLVAAIFQCLGVILTNIHASHSIKLRDPLLPSLASAKRKKERRANARPSLPWQAWDKTA